MGTKHNADVAFKQAKIRLACFPRHCKSGWGHFACTQREVPTAGCFCLFCAIDHCFCFIFSCAGGEGGVLAAACSVIGVGSDIGGSIRMPAFFNGVFGHKPTTGEALQVKHTEEEGSGEEAPLVASSGFCHRGAAAQRQANSCTGQAHCVSAAMRNHLMAGRQVHGRQEVSCDRYCIPSVGCFPSTSICCLGVSLTARTRCFQVVSGVVFSLEGCLAVPASCFCPLCTLPRGCKRSEEHHWKFLELGCNPQGTSANAWSRNTISRAPSQIPGAEMRCPGHRCEFPGQQCKHWTCNP